MGTNEGLGGFGDNARAKRTHYFALMPGLLCFAIVSGIALNTVKATTMIDEDKRYGDGNRFRVQTHGDLGPRSALN
jgi:hypothetical protein